MTTKFTKSMGVIALWTVVLVFCIFFGAEDPNAVILAQSISEYDVTSIDPPAGHSRSKAYGINNLGQVVGHFSNLDTDGTTEIQRQAFIWDPDSGAQLLSDLGGDTSAWGINDDAFVSGYSFNGVGQRHAVRWDSSDNFILDLGTLSNPTTGHQPIV